MRKNYTKSGNIKAVYTCVTNRYDELVDHAYMNKDWDYICFTNDDIKSKLNGGWEIFPLEYDKLDHVRNQRWHKLHPHILLPDYKYSLWVDANLEIKSEKVFQDVARTLSSNPKGLMAVSLHPKRDCIYQEAIACKKYAKGSSEVIDKQIQLIKKRGFPKHAGLFETGVIFRYHNNPEVIKLMESWWRWIESCSERDQLSLTYVAWENSFYIKPLASKPYNREGSDRIIIWPHNQDVRKDIRAFREELNKAAKRIKILEKQLDRNEHEIKNLMSENRNLKLVLENIYNSRSWKVAKHVSKISKIIRK